MSNDTPNPNPSSSEFVGDTPVAPIAPPTTAGELGRARRAARWPMVLGMVMSIVGGLGIITNIFGLVMQWLGLAENMVNVQGAEGVHEAMAPYQDWMYLNLGLGIVLAILLLVAGIGLCRRRRWSISLAMLWALLMIPAVVLEIWMTMEIQDAQFTAMAQQPGVPAAAAGVMQGMSTPIKVTTAVFAVVFNMALPVFILVWCKLPAQRREIATWSSRTSA